MKKMLCGILVTLAVFFASTSMADEYELNAQNLPNGSVIVTFDLLVDPGLTEVFLSNQYFSHFENLTRFNKSTQKGYPEVLSKQVTLSVDPNMIYTLRIVESEYETYNLSSPYLVGRGTLTRNQNPENIPYIIDANSLGLKKYPEKQIDLKEKFLIRNVSGFHFRFNVTEFNTELNTVKVYTHLKFQVVPEVGISEDSIAERDNAVIAELITILPHLFLNYEDNSIAQNYEARSRAGDILVIYTDRDENAIQPYIQHKQSLGFNVSTIKVGTGTNVKSIIQNAYNKNPNIFYVQLVGDWQDIKSDLGTSQYAPMDPMLGCVKGNDNYPDLAVGRFSASSADQVTIQVNKTIEYEKNTGQPFWKKALGIGSGSGPGDDGELDYQHIDVIKEYKLLPNQYSSVGEIYSSGSASQVADFVNNGTHLINYCGHGSPNSWGTTGFSSSNVNNLANGNKLPIIFSVACLNGTYHQGTCFAEDWLRKSNGGAVATLMATISQPWDPPMRGQDYMNDLLTGGYNYAGKPGNGKTTTTGFNRIGEIVLNGLILMYSESSNIDDLDTISTWTLFGDASLLVTPNSGSSGNTDSEIFSPVPGSALNSTSLTLSWHAGTNIQAYWIYVGNSQGANDIFNSGQLSSSTLSYSLSGLPDDGRRLYIRLWMFRGNNWEYKDYIYTAAMLQKYFIFINRATGKALDVNSDQYVYNYSNNGNSDKQWKIINIGSGYYKIVNKSNGKCLSVSNTGNYQSYARNLTDDGAIENQWYFQNTGNGYYKVLNRSNNKALDTNGSSPYVFVYTDNGNTDKQWKIYSAGQ